jgi:hypothetical protein
MRNEIEEDEGGGAGHTYRLTEIHTEIRRRKSEGDHLDWTTLAYTRDNIKIIIQRCKLPTIFSFYRVLLSVSIVLTYWDVEWVG